MKRRIPINKSSLLDTIVSSSVWYAPFNDSYYKKFIKKKPNRLLFLKPFKFG